MGPRGWVLARPGGERRLRALRWGPEMSAKGLRPDWRAVCPRPRGPEYLSAACPNGPLLRSGRG